MHGMVMAQACVMPGGLVTAAGVVGLIEMRFLRF